jgi:hypothetical protein
MKATVVGVNLGKGRVVAFSELGEYVLLELFSDEPEMQDVLVGHFDEHPLGGEMIKNVTQNVTMEFFIQDYCSKEHAQHYLNRN